MNTNRDFIHNEQDFLDSVSRTYKLSGSRYLQFKREFAIRIFAPFMHPDGCIDGGGRILQLGCADGFETSLLSKAAKELDVIDGSEEFIKQCEKTDYQNVRFMRTLFEEYRLSDDDEKYDCIFASYVFEHVLDVQTVLNMIGSVIKPSGLLFVVVPNARALSRQLALHMKIIDGLRELTENDKDHGHRRVYDRVTLNNDIENGGFEIIAQGGIIFKLLADFQLDKLVDDGFLTGEHMEGLYRLGLEYPDMCDALYAVCRRKKPNA
ncbi:class I SAM-dependent methyltransferase [Candidatus Pacearchaeota archaeon]|nr:class I SAM-dependent methyltransferase [Candidatus Pacearchaeota archaeon]